MNLYLKNIACKSIFFEHFLVFDEVHYGKLLLNLIVVSFILGTSISAILGIVTGITLKRLVG